MLSPWRVYDIVQHLQHHLSIPVTVKCRLGVDGIVILELQVDHDSYEELVRFIHIVSGEASRQGESPMDAASDDDVDSIVPMERIKNTYDPIDPKQYGCQHFIIHARKCVLHGLSTKENRSVPPLHYDWVYRLLDDFPQLDFTLNGGIVNLGVAKELIERESEKGRHIRGVMIGRLLTKSSWLFHYVDSFFYEDSTPDMSRYDVMMKYIEFCEKKIEDGGRILSLI